jgi:LEA14-like dessication related protein
MGLFRSVIVVILLIGAVGVGGAFYLGIFPPGGNIEQPSMSVEDIGDWGDVTDNSIEVIHTFSVQNPNPTGVEIGESITVGVQLEFNGIRLGSVQKSGLDIDRGDNTVMISSELQQDRIAEFWARFINQDETIHARVSADIQVEAGPGFSFSTPPVQKSVLTDEQPVSDALASIGDEMEGTYSKEVDTDEIANEYRPASGLNIGSSGTLTAEYTVERVEFEWGSVSPDQTELLIHMRVRNTGDTLLPGVPDGTAVDILLNDIEVFQVRNEAIAVRNADRDSVLRRGETQSYTLVVTAENQNIEEWFTTFASQGEQSTVRGELEFFFSLGGASVSIPEGGAVAYECRFQTGILVDDQTNTTTCGKNGTIEIGASQIKVSDLRDGTGGDSQTTATPTSDSQTTTQSSESTATETATSGNNPPTARASATPTQGEAPLEVLFDASESSDPDEDIQQYVWRFKDGSAPGEGETVTHTFRTAGEYDVELVVIDSQGNRDTTTVTITVESRVG